MNYIKLQKELLTKIGKASLKCYKIGEDQEDIWVYYHGYIVFRIPKCCWYLNYNIGAEDFDPSIFKRFDLDISYHNEMMVTNNLEINTDTLTPLQELKAVEDGTLIYIDRDLYRSYLNLEDYEIYKVGKSHEPVLLVADDEIRVIILPVKVRKD